VYDLARNEPQTERMVEQMALDDAMVYLPRREFSVLVALAAEGNATRAAEHFDMDRERFRGEVERARRAAFERIFDPEGTREATPEPPRATRIHREPTTVSELLDGYAARLAARNVAPPPAA
jgi:hypothetical protein